MSKESRWAPPDRNGGHPGQRQRRLGTLRLARKAWCIILAFAAASVLCGCWQTRENQETSDVNRAAAIPLIVAKPVNVLTEVQRIEWIGSEIYALLPNDNSIVVLDQAQQPTRRIGMIGNGPAQFVSPLDFSISDDGFLVVADTGNHRVQLLDRNGFPLDSFSVDRPVSVAFAGSETIAASSLQDPGKVTILRVDGSGREVLDATRESGLTPRIRAQLSRGRLIAVSGGGFIYIAYGLYPPKVKRYSPTGDLLWELLLEGPEVSKNIEEARKRVVEIENGTSSGYRRLVDSAEVAQENGHLLILIGYSDGSIRVHLEHAKTDTRFRLVGPSGQLLKADDMAFREGVLFIVSAGRIYRATLEAIDGRDYKRVS